MKLNDQHILKAVNYEQHQEHITRLHNHIHQKNGLGSDFLGWLDYQNTISEQLVASIIETAHYIKENFDVLVVCGIGGSYLGSRATIEAINGLYPHQKPEIIYLGHTFSSTHTYQVLQYLKDKKFAINVISKSGTTTETAIAFRLLRTMLESRLNKEELKKAIYCTTDPTSGALRQLALNEGYPIFELPSDIGGRYSVFTPVGLLPIAVSGIDIKSFLKGAQQAYDDFLITDITKNDAYRYALIRYHLYKTKAVEVLVTYEPQMNQLTNWWQQLFGESEGKEGNGIFPSSLNFSTDLHSLGQFIQEGSPILFETIVYFNKPTHDVSIPLTVFDQDGLNYLAGRNLSYVNEKAFLGTLDAHVHSGHVPNIIIEVAEPSPFEVGYLLYFFMKSCAMSAYLLKVNPFNQPGVEVYKRNMFNLLGKKGF